MFDIVIPLGPKDKILINDVVAHIKENVLGFDKIYIVSYDPTIEVEGCITIDEKIYPFSIDSIAERMASHERIGWFFQQLIKFYAGFVIPGIKENYLVIDADVFFLKPFTFMTEDDKFIFTVGYEYVIDYFIHCHKLHPSIKRFYPQYSGISHHMMMSSKYMNLLFDLVATNHGQKEFWKVFIDEVDLSCGIEQARASEYEIYFNYMCIYHAEKVQIRNSKWDNIKDFNMVDNHDYVSLPWWLREEDLDSGQECVYQ